MQRKKKLNIIYSAVGAVCLLVILLVLLIYTRNNRFLTYEDPRGLFSIKYPAAWEYDENVSGTAVIFYAPVENKMDFFRENVNVVIQDISAFPMGIKQYSETAIMQMEAVFGENLKVRKSAPTKLADRVGYEYIFIGKGDGFELGYKSVWTLDKLRAFQVTYTSLDSQYDSYLKQVDQMIKSFKIN